MKEKNQLLWLLPLVILSMTQCSQETIEAYHEQGYQRNATIVSEEIKTYTPTIEDNFDGSSVLVVMDKKTGGINKAHKKSFFGFFEVEYIKDLTEITGDINTKEYLNKELFKQILLIKLPTNSKNNVLNVIRQLEKVEGVLYASPNYYLYPAATHPDDPEYGGPSPTTGQWGLKGTYGINAPNAWDITTGARGIIVGIIDSGISPHEDLNANLLSGWNFENNNSNTIDTTGHGTKVAGVVGAAGNNYTGIAGVCWDVSLVPLVNRDDARYFVNDAISAISFAASAGIGTINFSQYCELPVTILDTAVQNYNGLFVCAAGNSTIGNNIDNNDLYVLLSQRPNTIIVGAINSSGYPSNSNVGKNTVHLFAPGEDIRTTGAGGGYLNDSGSSYATPHVAGAAALLKSVYPFLTAPQIKKVILGYVTKDTARLGNYCITGGRLNVEAALKSQGTVVGYFDIKFNNPNWGGAPGVIGRFYLFNDGKWTFVERGFKCSSQTLPNNYNISSFLQASPVPAAIVSYLNNRILNTTLEVMIPAYNPSFSLHYTGITVSFKLSGSTVTFSHINNTNRPIGSAMFYSNIFKITNKQGTL